MKWPHTRLGRILAKLQRHYGQPATPKLSGPFEWILWEICAYLKDDEHRAAAFAALRDRVGLTPEKIRAAPKSLLIEITRIGGIVPELRAERLQISAELALKIDLSSLGKLPAPKAKKLLRCFPMIGDPGAEKILLFSHVQPILPFDSNGLRVVTRLGFAEERKNYSATYREARLATDAELPSDYSLLRRSHLLLRRHGQQLCLRNGPVCHACPVSAECSFFQSS